MENYFKHFVNRELTYYQYSYYISFFDSNGLPSLSKFKNPTNARKVILFDKIFDMVSIGQVCNGILAPNLVAQ